jgi:hypothetical protein
MTSFSQDRFLGPDELRKGIGALVLLVSLLDANYTAVKHES